MLLVRVAALRASLLVRESEDDFSQLFYEVPGDVVTVGTWGNLG